MESGDGFGAEGAGELVVIIDGAEGGDGGVVPAVEENELAAAGEEGVEVRGGGVEGGGGALLGDEGSRG